VRQLAGPPARALLLGLPLVWFAHLATGYTVASLHCHEGWFEGEAAGLPVVRIVLAALTLAVVGYVAFTASILWRERQTGGDAARFRAFVGLLLCANIGAYLVWSVIPVLIADVCG
jgi:hypothetical protein